MNKNSKEKRAEKVWGAMHKWPHPLRGEGRSAKKWRYSISLFIAKWVTSGREGISKNRWRHLWTAPEAMSSTDSCMAYIKDSLVNYWEGSSIAMEGILCRGTQHQRITTRASRSPPPPHFFSICCQNGYYHTTLLLHSAYVHVMCFQNPPDIYGRRGSGGIVVGNNSHSHSRALIIECM